MVGFDGLGFWLCLFWGVFYGSRAEVLVLAVLFSSRWFGEL